VVFHYCHLQRWLVALFFVLMTKALFSFVQVVVDPPHVVHAPHWVVVEVGAAAVV
jgi:hypothetical protein